MKFIGSIKRAIVRFVLSNSATRKIAHKIVYDPEFLDALPIDAELIDRIFEDRALLERFLYDERTASLIATTPRLIRRAQKILSVAHDEYTPPKRDAADIPDQATLTANLLGQLGPADALVSVIIPCYNYGEFVGEAVQSVLNQSYPNIEIVVVNDGSTDRRTIDALASLASDRVRVLNQENQGLSMARNNGAAAAKGEYLVFLDADDTLEPDAIALMLFQLKRDPNAAAVYPAIRFFGGENMVWCPGEFNAYDLLWANHPSVCAMIRRGDFEASDKYQVSMKYGYEDWEFNLGLSRIGKRFRYLPVPVFNYRRHGRTMVAEAHSKKTYLHRELRRLNEKLYSIESISRIKREWRPLVSAIVLSSGEAPELKRALDSIRNQTIDDIEVLPADSSEKIEQATREARGDFIVIVSAGTVLDPQSIESLSLSLLLSPLAVSACSDKKPDISLQRRKTLLQQHDQANRQLTSNDSVVSNYESFYFHAKLGEGIKYDGFRRQNTPNLFQRKYHDSDRINLLMCVPHMVIGGAESIDLDILSGLDRSRFRIVLAVEKEADHAWRERYRTLVDEMFLLPDYGAGDFAGDRLVDYLIVSKNIDILFNRNTHMGYRAMKRWADMTDQIRTVDLLHLHHFGADWVGVSAKYHRYIHRHYVTNQDLKQYAAKEYDIRSEKVNVIYCGVNTERWNPDATEHGRIRKEWPWAEDKQIVGFVGRFDAQKEPLKWIHVAQEILRKKSDVAFMMIGGGPLFDDAVHLAQKLNISQHIRFIGFRDDIPELMADLDCLLLVSSHEGLPQVVFEAMGMGVPIVASDAGGTRECVSGELGRIVPIEASPAEYAEQTVAMLDALKQNPELRNMNRDHIVQNFEVRRMQSAYASEFESLFSEVDREKRYIDLQLSLMRNSIFG